MRVNVSVSEPWDIGEAIAWRARPGLLAKVGIVDGREVMLIKLDEPINYGDRSWNYLIGAPRHHGDQVSMLSEGRKMPISIIGISTQQATSDVPFVRPGVQGGLACIGVIEPA
jgi:hypothetical protein